MINNDKTENKKTRLNIINKKIASIILNKEFETI